MKTVAIVPAAGCGRRLGSRIKKPFILLNGRALVSYALRTLDRCKIIDAVIIAAEKSCICNFRNLVDELGLRKVTAIVAGGRTRSESVRNCIRTVDDSFDIVLIHDGARPFADEALFEKTVRLAGKYGACLAAVPENDTVKLTGRDMFVDKTLDRSRIFRAQTPQAFRRELIKKAYIRRGPLEVTDDSSLVEALGARVKILPGSYANMKITTKEDLLMAEALCV